MHCPSFYRCVCVCVCLRCQCAECRWLVSLLILFFNVKMNFKYATNNVFSNHQSSLSIDVCIIVYFWFIWFSNNCLIQLYVSHTCRSRQSWNLSNCIRISTHNTPKRNRYFVNTFAVNYWPDKPSFTCLLRISFPRNHTNFEAIRLYCCFMFETGG